MTTAGRGSEQDLEGLARRLEADPRYKVLRQFAPRTRYAQDDDSPRALALAIDVETTGLDPQADAIIQLALLPFEYGRDTGLVYSVRDPLVYFQDPGRPIPPEITDLTGIADHDVAGKQIDITAVSEVAASAALVIAHNADFDRKFVERQLPVFRSHPWACSMREIPWRPAGNASASLEYLLMQTCGMFFGAHRADNDCAALVHLLTSTLPDGESALTHLLTSARQKTHRIWAIDAPYDFKELLKARRYRWSPGEAGRPRAWYKDVLVPDSEAELDWLSANIYGDRKGPWRIDTLDAKTRYSDRA